MTSDTDWLSLDPDNEPDTRRGPSPRKARRKKRRKRAAPAVQAVTKLPTERGRAPSMQRRLFGKDRIWACDGEFVYFRPTRMIDGVKTTVANPTTFERHRGFLAAGHYTWVETQDDVEVYRVNPESPFARKGVYLGEMSDSDVRRQVAIAACKRDWVAYTDCLEELFGRIKNRGYSGAMAEQVKNDYLAYLDQLIAMRGGPTPAECGAGLAGVRKKRGVGTGRVVLIPGNA